MIATENTEMHGKFPLNGFRNPSVRSVAIHNVRLGGLVKRTRKKTAPAGHDLRLVPQKARSKKKFVEKFTLQFDWTFR